MLSGEERKNICLLSCAVEKNMNPVFVAAAIAFSAILVLQPSLPCDKTFVDAIQRPAFHGSWGHLAVNLFAFYALTQSIQPRIGTVKYIMLIGFLWLVTSIMDLFFAKNCSIGFSGVVLGLLVWDLFDKGQLKWDLAAMASLALIWIQPLVQGQQQVSMAGHFYGIVAGLMAVFLFPQSRIAPA